MTHYSSQKGRPVGKDGPKYRTLGIPVSERELKALELISAANPIASGGTIAGAVRFAIRQAARQIVTTTGGERGNTTD